MYWCWWCCSQEAHDAWHAANFWAGTTKVTTDTGQVGDERAREQHNKGSYTEDKPCVKCNHPDKLFLPPFDCNYSQGWKSKPRCRYCKTMTDRARNAKAKLKRDAANAVLVD